MSEPSLETFVAARGQALVRFAFVLCGGDGYRAEDLVQASLAKVWRRWGQICSRGNPEAYLRRVIVTEELTWRRRRWSSERVTDAVPDLAGTDATENIDAADAAWRTVATLPKGQRAVLVLRYLADWSDEAIAAQLGCSEATVRSQASRGLAELRRAGTDTTRTSAEVSGRNHD